MTLELVRTDVEQPTRREREVVAVLMLGETTNEQIANHLIISPATVKFHLASVMRKCGVNNRTALVSYAWRNGVVIDQQWCPFGA